MAGKEAAHPDEARPVAGDIAEREVRVQRGEVRLGPEAGQLEERLHSEPSHARSPPYSAGKPCSARSRARSTAARQRAVGHDDGLIAVLVVDRISKQGRDRLVVFADDDDLLFSVFCHIVHAAIYRRSCALAKAR